MAAARVARLVIVGSLGGLAACKTDPPAPTASSAAPSASAEEIPPGLEGAPKGDEIRSVYPVTTDPPDPVATRYCHLVHERAEEKRRACCPGTTFFPFLPTAECARTLSAALRASAVAIEPAALDACEAAVAEESKHCDWGGTMPAACVGIVRGRIADGAACRSSLECGDGLFCAGLTPTHVGRCARPLPEGGTCGGSADQLAAFVRQEVEPAHPDCEGYCKLRRCTAPVGVGQRCAASVECGRGGHCVGGTCSAGALPLAGEPCAGEPCAAGHRCLEGVCAAPKRLGEPCGSDEACRSGHCEAGGCALSCAPFRPAPAASASAPAAAPEPSAAGRGRRPRPRVSAGERGR
jgi:hypothetical protein